MIKLLVFSILILFNFSILKADDYFKALQLFNMRKVDDSLILFKKVSLDKNHQKRSDAMFNLAVIFDNGFGTKTDKTRALYYYEEASNLSNKYAQYNLGWKFFNGENVNKDVIKAYELYKSAATSGHPEAMFNLANMYYSGTGTVKDLKLAYKYFLEAKINGIGESQYYIDKISKLLTPQELAFLENEYGSLIENKINLPEQVIEDN